MHIRSLNDIEAINSPTGEVIHELGGAAVGGLSAHSLAHIRLPKGGHAAPHYHPIAEESYYILSGTGRMVLDGQEREVSAGQMVAIPAGQIHAIYNDGAEDLVFLAVCVPPWSPDCSVFVDEV